MNRLASIALATLVAANVASSRADTCSLEELKQNVPIPTAGCAVKGRILSARPTVGVFDQDGKFKCEIAETPQGTKAAALRPSELPTTRAAEVVDCNTVLGIVLIKATDGNEAPYLFWAERNDVRSAGEQNSIQCNAKAPTNRDDLKTPTAAGSGESCKKADSK
jgi:hypothetical protein